MEKHRVTKITLFAVLASAAIRTVTGVGVPLVFTLTSILTKALSAKISFCRTAWKKKRENSR